MASRAGATVVATAGPAHADRLRGFGATEVIDSHTDGWAHDTGHRFDAVLIAARGTADAAMTLLDDGGRLCSITSDAPAPERGITSTNHYVRSDAGQLAHLAALAAVGPSLSRSTPSRSKRDPPLPTWSRPEAQEGPSTSWSSDQVRVSLFLQGIRATAAGVADPGTPRCRIAPAHRHPAADSERQSWTT
jgi:hypothetical protein